jgi:hypothetical protein
LDQAKAHDQSEREKEDEIGEDGKATVAETSTLGFSASKGSVDENERVNVGVNEVQGPEEAEGSHEAEQEQEQEENDKGREAHASLASEVDVLFSKARFNRKHEMASMLDDLRSQLDVDVEDGAGNTLLITACQNNHRKIAKELLRRACDVNHQNHDGNTCLHYCFALNYSDLGKYLISKGAEPTLRNQRGQTCYEAYTLERGVFFGPDSLGLPKPSSQGLGDVSHTPATANTMVSTLKTLGKGEGEEKDAEEEEEEEEIEAEEDEDEDEEKEEEEQKEEEKEEEEAEITVVSHIELYDCDYKCGYRGPFLQVEEHELRCTYAPHSAPPNAGRRQLTRTNAHKKTHLTRANALMAPFHSIGCSGQLEGGLVPLSVTHPASGEAFRTGSAVYASLGGEVASANVALGKGATALDESEDEFDSIFTSAVFGADASTNPSPMAQRARVANSELHSAADELLTSLSLSHSLLQFASLARTPACLNTDGDDEEEVEMSPRPPSPPQMSGIVQDAQGVQVGQASGGGMKGGVCVREESQSCKMERKTLELKRQYTAGASKPSDGLAGVGFSFTTSPDGAFVISALAPTGAAAKSG